MRERLIVWAWVWLAWTALALFFATSLWLNYVSQGREANFQASLLVSLSEWWIWAALTPVVVQLARWFPLQRSGLARAVSVHLMSAVALSVVKVLAERVVRQWMFGVAPYFLPSNLALHFLVYWALVGVTLAIQYYRASQAQALRASETEARLHEARVQLLQAQLQPHFLFNALNTIAEVVHEDPERADRMIGSLSELLRASLDADSQAVPVDEEARIARIYLDIQQARFGDRLQVAWHIDDDCAAWPVPRLLLQPLLENAVQHGIAPTHAGGSIVITARRTASGLQLIVADDGAGPSGGAGAGSGIGVSNTRARLAAAYGDAASLTVRPRPAGGTEAIVTIPEVPA
jgi:hypothetical protein